jgi:hypothetical protein
VAYYRRSCWLPVMPPSSTPASARLIDRRVRSASLEGRAQPRVAALSRQVGRAGVAGSVRCIPHRIARGQHGRRSPPTRFVRASIAGSATDHLAASTAPGELQIGHDGQLPWNIQARLRAPGADSTLGTTRSGRPRLFLISTRNHRCRRATGTFHGVLRVEPRGASVELGDAAAWTSAAVAVGAACTSIWQARIAKRGADLSSRQASAAEQQAVDAERAANIALEQLALARSQLDQDKGTSAVSVGPVRGRCAGCGAAPPRSRAPAASLPRGRCAPPWTCEPRRPLGQSVRAGQGPARQGCAAPPNLARAGGRR